MNIRPPFIAHHEWADSVADWAMQNRFDTERKSELEADCGPMERHEGVLYTAPQGRVEQGWPARRCSPEMAVWDSTQDDDKREAASGLDVSITIVGFIASACISVWLLCVFKDQLQPVFSALFGWMQ